MINKNRNVLRSVTEPRNSDRNNVKPVIKVPPEFAFLHKLLQIPVGGRNYTHIGFYRCGPSHSVKLSILDYSEELCLHVKGKLTYFIQEHYPIVGKLKIAFFA